MDKVYFVMLGKFDLLVNGQSALSHISGSTKSVSLLKYLVLNGKKAFSSAALLEIFWADDEKSANPENALKTMISRLRGNLLKISPAFKDCIITENRSYMWNMDDACEVDALLFESLCGQLRQAESSDAQTRERFMRILDLYKGDLASPDMEEGWLVSRSLYLHHLYLQTVYRFIELLKADGTEESAEMIIHVCRCALDIDMFDEKLNLELMRALKDRGQSNTALMQYRHITNAYYKRLGIEPSESIFNFYKSLIQSDVDTFSNIQSIRKDLMKKEDANAKPLFCEYLIFKDIYDLQLRIIERFKGEIFLMLVKVENMAGDHIEPLILDSVMRGLLEILRECLRKGDTIARYNSSQYVVLLPMISYSDGNIVIGRIKKMFYKRYADNSVRPIFQFGKIDEEHLAIL